MSESFSEKVLQEMFSLRKVDVEGLPSEEYSLLAGAKDLSEMRELKTFQSLAAKIKNLFSLSLNSLDQVPIIFFRVE